MNCELLGIKFCILFLLIWLYSNSWKNQENRKTNHTWLNKINNFQNQRARVSWNRKCWPTFKNFGYHRLIFLQKLQSRRNSISWSKNFKNLSYFLISSSRRSLASCEHFRKPSSKQSRNFRVWDYNFANMFVNVSNAWF